MKEKILVPLKLKKILTGSQNLIFVYKMENQGHQHCKSIYDYFYRTGTNKYLILRRLRKCKAIVDQF